MRKQAQGAGRYVLGCFDISLTKRTEEASLHMQENVVMTPLYEKHTKITKFFRDIPLSAKADSGICFSLCSVKY